VPPVLIENQMKAAMVALSNCMVVGDRQKFLAMFISLKTEVNPDTGEPTDVLAKDALFVGNEIGSAATTVTEARDDPKWSKYFDEGMKAGNSKTTSNAQIVQKWKLLAVDFSEKQGDLTPTLKLKRNVVTKKLADDIEALYA
jgi:long-chain-fatty-acid--CoA ligase ACSBG